MSKRFTDTVKHLFGWGERLVQTDVRNPDGGYFYAVANIRPWWFWSMRRWRLFLSILWRRYDRRRIDWRTAWKVSTVAKGLSKPK